MMVTDASWALIAALRKKAPMSIYCQEVLSCFSVPPPKVALSVFDFKISAASPAVGALRTAMSFTRRRKKSCSNEPSYGSAPAVAID